MTTADLPVPAPTVDQAQPTVEGGRPDHPLVTPRGETVIGPAVVEKIAARAASEVDGVGGVVRTGLSRLIPWSLEGASAARAHAEMSDKADGEVSLDLSVNVVYPHPVAAVTNQVRARVAQRLLEMCGLRVSRLDISVPALVAEPARPRRRVQ